MTGPSTGTGKWPAGLLAAYPAGWRARYGEELELLIADMRAGGRGRLPMASDLLRGAAAAWLNGKKGFVMSERSRNALYTVLWSWVAFAAIAAVFGHDLGVYPRPVVGAWTVIGGPAAPGAYYVLLAAGVVGLAATGLAALAFAVGVARDARARRPRRVYLMMAVPPVIAAAWLGGLQLLPRAGGRGPDGLGLLWALLGVAGIAVATKVVINLTRTSELTELTWRIGTVMAVVVTAAMLVATGATIAWGLLVRSGQVNAGPLSGWLLVTVIMSVMTVRAIIALLAFRQSGQPAVTQSPAAA